MEVSAFTFMALLVAREGTLVTGGHQIMSNLAALCYMMPMALGVATAALTAQAIGAGKLDQAHRIGMAGLTLGLMGALLTAAVLLIGRPLILAAYTDKAEVAAVAATLLAVLPLFHLFDSMRCINSYLLRAYKIAVVPLLLRGAGRRRPGGRLVVRLRPRQGRTGLAAPDPRARIAPGRRHDVADGDGRTGAVGRAAALLVSPHRAPGRP